MDSAQVGPGGRSDGWPRHPLVDVSLARTLEAAATAVFSLSGGEPLWWNAPGAALFNLPGAGTGAGDLAAAFKRAAGSERPWLERRRLSRAGRQSLATLYFRRVKLVDGREALLAQATSVAPPLAASGHAIPPPTQAETTSRPAHGVARKPGDAGSRAETATPSEELGTAPVQALSPSGGRRLTWQTDAEGHLLAGPGASLSQALGRGAPMQPTMLADLLLEAGAARGAIASGRAFAGLPVETVANPEGASFIGALFGSPALDRDRRPTGYRGFLLVSSVASVAKSSGPADKVEAATSEAGSPTNADARSALEAGRVAESGALTDPSDQVSVATVDPVGVDLSSGHGALPPPGEVEDVAGEPLLDEAVLGTSLASAATAQLVAEPIAAISAEPASASAELTEEPPSRLVEGARAARASAGQSVTEMAGMPDPLAPIWTAATGHAEPALRLPAAGEQLRRASNVIALRPPNLESARAREEAPGLSPAERDAFADIAKALGASFASAPIRKEGVLVPGERTAALTPSTEAAYSTRQEMDALAADPLTGRTELGIGDARPSARMGAPSGTERGLAGAMSRGFADVSHADLMTIINRLPIAVAIQWRGKAAAVNKTMLDLLDYADLEDFQAHGGLERLFVDQSNKAAQERATAIKARDGEVIDVDARCQAVKWRGETATLLSLRRSLSGEAKALDEAQRSALAAREAQIAELRAILENASDGVVTIDELGRILAMNHAAEALFGYAAREIASEAFTVLLEADHHAAASSWLREITGGGAIQGSNEAREMTGRERQGRPIPLSMKLFRGPSRLHAVFRNLTVAKEQETSLIEARATAERMTAQKSEFLAKVSHEIRTPLNSIVGFADIIAEERFGPLSNERYREYLRDIRSSGTHIISLVNDLLDLSKIEAGRMELSFADVNLNAEINVAVALVQMDAARARVLMRQSFAPALPTVLADARSIKQIALNLLANAVKFTDPGGQVIISTAVSKRGEVVFRVRDTGIGMTERQLAEAMEPFRQFATARRQGGSGLGLSLTKALVKANHADLSISSSSGEGTLVEVIFPRSRVTAN